MPAPGLLTRIRRAWRATRDPADPFWYTTDPATGFAYGGGARSSAGMNVTPDSALTIGAVFRAVRLLADDVAQLPLHVYRTLPDRGLGRAGGKERIRTGLAEVIGKRPNARQTSYEFRQMLTAHLLLRGNGYARIVPGAAGAVSSLEPIIPTRVRPVLTDAGRVVYIVRDRSGVEERIAQDDMFHLRGFSTDPESAEGMSPVTLARTSFGLTIATEEFGARQFSQTPQPSFLLTHPKRLDDAQAKRIAASFRDAWSGPSGWGGAPVLEEGMTAAPVGMSHDDAQFLQTRQHQVTDVARWFGVPPHMIGDLSRATFSNIEQQSIDYLTHSLLPWLVLWEQTILRDLVLDDTFAEFVVDGLLRADSLAAAQAEQLHINMRSTTPNEVRARRNMNPVPWGDEPAMPQGAPAPPPPTGRAPALPRDDPPDAEDDPAEETANA